ncbi:DUF5958 family protein [Streptomyces sp. NWU339]|uniref:DUF5958 family protein n=1 Tax=Streptomyces sp. NWU339 TaxID=2185284 RepID=UPI001C6328B5|nr:DUF5958 family protein [Streptomyces sp. NWU339]
MGAQASALVRRCSSALSRSGTRTRRDLPVCGKARACEEDVPESIARSGIRSTHTPAVRLTKWCFGMEGLPAYELAESFRLLVALFSIADTRRRTPYRAGERGHARHNLPDPPRGAT